jgi:predicted Zn-dependent protease with MMP-like domain
VSLGRGLPRSPGERPRVASAGMAAAPFPRARDRRGRGPRGPLAPSTVPLRRGKADRFDEVVLDAVEHLEGRWADDLTTVEFAVETVPPDEEPSADGDPVALSRLEPPGDGPARIVLYRRPLEARGRDEEDLADLVLDVLVHEVARLLGLTPEVVDPEGHPPD